jgi:hypothetical protein
MPCHPWARTLQSEVGRAMPDNDLMASANCRKKIWAATGRPTTTCSVFDIPLEGWFLRFRTTGAEAGRYRSLRRTRLEIHWAFPTWCHDWRNIGGHRTALPIASRHCQPISPAQTAGLPYGMRSVGPDAT